MSIPTSLLQDHVSALAEARHHDPFAILGPHAGEGKNKWLVRLYLPGALAVEVLPREGGGRPVEAREVAPGLFEAPLSRKPRYRLGITWPEARQETADPYSFGPQLGELDLHLISEGRHFDLARVLGANLRTVDGVDGVLFAVWAPNASSAAVVGDFNSWDARRHLMRLRHGTGLWEIFMPGVTPGMTYKFALKGPGGIDLPWKADPLARATELPPHTSSVVAPAPDFTWSDEAWMAGRAERQRAEAPVSIYEVHVSSWLRTAYGQFGSWDEAAERLIPYVAGLGFTHLELLPITEHPFGGSWGYQPLSLFAPTARLGSPEAFARFVDRCHAAGLGVLLDWVPAHFPSDEHGLARFDGTALYEHEDPREGFHRDWNTLIYNLGRLEVRGFLTASALWWLSTFHLDGLRVDAVASMLYRDYSREPGEWVPNRFGGRENLEAISFLQHLNLVVRERCPGAITIAEESTAWPGVTAPVKDGGLGFDFKWSMGWMHDTLRFFARDPIYRHHHLDDITFGLLYGFSERFVLPLSHDEVVHGKGSMIDKMPGDNWQKFANLRLCYALMWCHPGKKLIFMGAEFAQGGEWQVDDPFPWPDGDDGMRHGLMRLVGDLNRLYRTEPGLYSRDHLPQGFEWLVADDAANTVFAFLRRGDRVRPLLVVANATPVPRFDYRIGVPQGGLWRELLNSDAGIYGGANLGNSGGVHAEPGYAHGQQQMLSLTLPPLGLIVLAPEEE
jgi:1,4-alpha-glucan branching enzyme